MHRASAQPAVYGTLVMVAAAALSSCDIPSETVAPSEAATSAAAPATSDLRRFKEFQWTNPHAWIQPDGTVLGLGDAPKPLPLR